MKRTMSKSTQPNACGNNKNIILLLGGARSGKSIFAEQCGKHFSKVIYFATARKIETDSEMLERIAQHLERRPKHWKTIEPPAALDSLPRACEIEEPDAIIIDSTTLWLGWELSRAHYQYTKKQLISHMENEVRFFVKTIQGMKCPVFVVSNEIGQGVVPEYQSGRIFRDLQGILNTKIAELAHFVCAFYAGQALLIKDARYEVNKQNGGYLPLAAVSPEWICRNLAK